MSKAHAEHNEAVCIELHAAPNLYNDWVVTTAFYSALHFVRHKVFPHKETINGKPVNFVELDNYFDAKKKSGWKGSKHSLLAQLVAKKAAPIHPDYKRLLDWSMTARYTNYKTSLALADNAVVRLAKIKAHCCV